MVSIAMGVKKRYPTMSLKESNSGSLENLHRIDADSESLLSTETSTAKVGHMTQCCLVLVYMYQCVYNVRCNFLLSCLK